MLILYLVWEARVMIAMRRMLSTMFPVNRPPDLCPAGRLLLLAGCVADVAPTGARGREANRDRRYLRHAGRHRAALPGMAAGEQPEAIVLALHGMNDSRDAWEYPGPDFAAAGIAVFAPDLRGFGATRTRGLWPGTDGLTDDIRVMARLLRARYPHTRLILMAESMGAAALMVLATQPDPPPVDGYVLIAPAVWGRAEMNLLLRGRRCGSPTNPCPAWTLTGRGIVKVTASDNRAGVDPPVHTTR